MKKFENVTELANTVQGAIDQVMEDIQTVGSVSETA